MTEVDSNNDNIGFGSGTAGGGPTGVDTFQMRTTGGVRFVTDVVTDDTAADPVGDVQTGAYLAAGGSQWQAVSARSAKHDISPVDAGGVLDALEDIEVATWSYDAQANEGTTHMGPMAGEFHEAFGVGGDAETIGHVDADGVSLAAIQGLAERLEEKAARIDKLESAVESKDARIDDLEARMATLEAHVDTADSSAAV